MDIYYIQNSFKSIESFVVQFSDYTTGLSTLLLNSRYFSINWIYLFIQNEIYLETETVLQLHTSVIKE